MDKITEQIVRRRMHGLYLSRKCDDITLLSHKLLGLHCWFHRNVAFSASIRGANLAGWKTALTKTWLYRGTLHGVISEDLPLLLGLHSDDPCSWLLEDGRLTDVAEKFAERVLDLMQDGVYSRAEMRGIFAQEFDPRIVARLLSPWGGIFVYLARRGKVAFRSMTSRDFDLISAEPAQSADEVLPELIRRFFSAYGPATLADAAWFLGLWKEKKHFLSKINMDEFSRLEHNGNIYYYVNEKTPSNQIPELTLLSGFDPLIVSYVDRSAVLPLEYRNAVILKSGICLPTIAVCGKVAGIWNIKQGQPLVEFFAPQSKRIKNAAFEMVENVLRQTTGLI